MKEHPSGIFTYDREATKLGYSQLDYSFTDSTTEDICKDKVMNPMKRNSVNLGIDFAKPFEEIKLDEDRYQIEYLFVGKLRNTDGYIADDQVGINIYTENRFGKEYFNTTELLNLTLII